MSISEKEQDKEADKEQLEFQVIHYLYGSMDAAERQQFESRLQSDPRLQELLDQEQQLNAVIPQGLKPRIDDERVQGNRFMLRQRLQKEARNEFSFMQWFAELRERPFSVAMQGAAMAATFVLGVLVASGTGNVTVVPEATESGSVSPLAFVGEQDYEIFQFQVDSYDAATGDIELSFALASESRVTGNVADAQIHSLMAVALQNDIDSAARLDTIEVLQPHVTGREVYQALIHVLDNDQNPGVRYQAVQALVQLADEVPVRDALRRALQQDVNPGVRVQAFQALANYQEPETLEIFRQRMDEDSNEFIRSRAREIVEAGGAEAIEL